MYRTAWKRGKRFQSSLGPRKRANRRGGIAAKKELSSGTTGLLRLLRVDFELVLRRPIETTALTGQLKLI